MKPLPPDDAGSGSDDKPERRTPIFTVSEEVQEHFVHPDDRRFFDRHPWTRRIPIFGPSCEGYGPKCVAGLRVVHLLCKGIADDLVHGLVYAMLVNRYHVAGDKYQRLATLYSLGWSAKPFTAMLCDSLALLCHTKRWYMAISCVVGAMRVLAFALLPVEEASANTAAVLIFLTSYCKANVDILSNGFYSRLMIKYPHQGPALVSWAWWFLLLGGIISSALTGPLADAGIPQVGLCISMVLQLITCVVFIFNLYGEKTNREERTEDLMNMHLRSLKDKEPFVPDTTNDGDVKMNRSGNEMVLHESLQGIIEEEMEGPPTYEPVVSCCGIFEFNKDVFMENWRMFLHGVIMTCSVVAMIVCNIFADKLGLLMVCIGVSVVRCGASFWALPMAIAKVNIFGYLQTLTFIRLPGALNTF
ncbi:unnamed protein product [Phytomonas sp. EM1]|nr:unnamed protein product [Phytomonas sp. EM1]|eukprot:CCW65735.1 unnamed protein product [Phytomonas sp. isolate EM1]